MFTDDHNNIIIVFVVLFSSTDTTLSEENVKKVFEVVRGVVYDVGDSLGVPHSVREKIQSTSQDVKQQWREVGHYWLTTCTSVSWMVLADTLYHYREKEALQRLMPYLNKTRGMC